MIREGFQRLFDWEAHGCEAAEQSGCGDCRVITKVFKKSEGIIPSQYRRDFLDAKEKIDERRIFDL